jgi:hypothetical protein
MAKPPRCPVPAFLKSGTRTHHRYGRIVGGKASDQRSLVKQTRLAEVHVGRILACAFLAPDIVEAILGGRQAYSLTVGKLQKNLAMSWAEQRRSSADFRLIDPAAFLELVRNV